MCGADTCDSKRACSHSVVNEYIDQFSQLNLQKGIIKGQQHSIL